MNFKDYKITYQIFNFFKKNQLTHNIPLYTKFNLKKRYFSSVSSEDFKTLNSPLNIHDLNDSLIEMPKSKNFQALDKDLQLTLSDWSKNGYVILKKQFTESEIDSCNEEVDKLIENKKVKFGFANKIMFAFHHSELIYKMGVNNQLLEIGYCYDLV